MFVYLDISGLQDVAVVWQMPRWSDWKVHKRQAESTPHVRKQQQAQDILLITVNDVSAAHFLIAHVSYVSLNQNSIDWFLRHFASKMKGITALAPLVLISLRKRENKCLLLVSNVWALGPYSSFSFRTSRINSTKVWGAANCSHEFGWSGAGILFIYCLHV